MSVPSAPGKSIRFNPPPNWPVPPPGWTPPPGWAPHPAWPPPPAGWQLWIADSGYAHEGSGAAMGAHARRTRRPPRWVIILAVLVVGFIIAAVTPGILGHVFALIVWAVAAWSCVRPARARTASAARTWGRIGIAVFACLAVYAGSLAVVGIGAGSTSDSRTQPTAASNAPFCYLTITGEITVYVAIMGMNNNDCQTAALQVQQITLGGTVNTDSARPFPRGAGVACVGTIDGKPATVVTTGGGDGGLCSGLGFGAAP